MRDDWQQHLLEEITKGRSVREICRDDADMPSREFVRRKLLESEALAEGNAGFVGQYARACADRADDMFDEMVEIADTPVQGKKVKIDKDGNEEVHIGDMIEHRRLQVDTRKWVLGRMNPKKYGDKLAVGGADDLPPIKAEMTTEETARRLAFLLTQATQDETK